MRILLILLLLSSNCFALTPYQKGLEDGVLKGISVSYKTFRQMFKDKKNRNEYLKRLVAEIQAQKLYEARNK